MKVFVAENCLYNNSPYANPGLLVVKAKDKETAIERIDRALSDFRKRWDEFDDKKEDLSILDRVKENLRELEDDELVYAYGQGD